jgi:16S rRNA (cytosine1402-N4)-methyltransferase
MRMDTGQELSAREIVNEWTTSRLATVLREFGEERHARSIAFEIERRRPLETTSELVEAIRAAVPPAYRFGRGHPAKRSFQAIRIAVNGELDSLDRGLVAGWNLIGDGGRFGAIAFHSLEDRRVKRFLADLATGCICPPEIPVCVCGHEPEAKLITRRAVKPSEDEIERNPRSRSARLRVARRIGDAGSPRSEGENARR